MQSSSFSELLRVFTRIGFLSFGGPAGQIALMHKELVDDRRWVEEGAFLRALNFCHLLPGPEAQQLATWIGWRLHGVRGGVAAGLLFVIPGAVIMFALSLLYVLAVGAPWFDGVFLGIKAAVLALVVQALIRIGGRALGTPFKQALALAAFLALFLFNLPFPIVVLGAGALGMVVAGARPNWLKIKLSESAGQAPAASLIMGTLRTVGTWGAIWAAPMLLIALTLGQGHVLFTIGAFFSKLAVVTFGGAYAVLAYMAQEAVQVHGWLLPGEMADGLGLAESTPGPLIMVTQFVGFLGAWRAPDPFSPLTAAILGSALTTWVTFAPCFLFIFALAPWIERLEHARRLQGGLAALTAAVVGVIANLALWFALHVLFARVDVVQAGPLTLQSPDWTTLDPSALVIAMIAGLVLLHWKRGVIQTLVLCGALGAATAWL